MTVVSPNQFSEFFHTLWGHEPFPWQKILAERVASATEADSSWPAAITLPTAAGKTACIDIAVFALACQAAWQPQERTASRRIFFVVDRRVIVDEAYERAKKLAEKLRIPRKGLLKDVADGLQSITGHVISADDHAEAPLACALLRGGIYRDDAWARTPSQPTVICTTVDQIGSRLLYRGYGKSFKSWPLHAGLAANDSLILLDEAHCAIPFMQTALAVSRYRRWAEDSHRLAAPFHVVVMSATPPENVERFGLTRADRENNVLRKRITASKPTRLVEIKGKTGTEPFAKSLAKEAEGLAESGARRIAVIVNRVATARLVFRLMKADDPHKVLMIGRMRPLDRDELMAKWQGRLKAEPNREDVDGPVFVVATQCLEVGANLDFDAMVSECASLDALRQRFGRLNRLGEAAQCRAVVAISANQVKTDAQIDELDKQEKADDPIYGNALARTWNWLKTHAKDDEIDMGVTAIDVVLPADEHDHRRLPGALAAPTADAPVMLPAHVDCWVQTAPEPKPSPDVALFLHGPRRGAPDVQVCWRADLDAAWPDKQTWIDIVALCPPAYGECMSVPLHLVRNWLKGTATPDSDLADVESNIAPDEPDQDAGQVPPVVLRWLGPDDSELASVPSDVRPGDTLVIPASQGGWDVFGHIPLDRTGSACQVDRGDEACLAARGKAVLRLHPELIAAWPDCPARKQWAETLKSQDLADRIGDGGFLDELRNSLRELAQAEGRPAWLANAALALASDSRLAKNIFAYPAGQAVAEPGESNWQANPVGGLLLRGSKRLARGEGESDTFTHEDDTASATVAVSLDKHCSVVAQTVERFATACGLAEPLGADLRLAARLHDLGKADPRFQTLLRGGNLRAVKRGELLAKSAGMPLRGKAYAEACYRCDYPKGERHEFFSVRLAEGAEDVLSQAHDADLVLHLIAAHHGHCRPFAPVRGPLPPEVLGGLRPIVTPFDGRQIDFRPRPNTATGHGLERLDSGVAERFWKLIRRYGWWGLAYLESILILADHRTSEDEQRKADAGAETDAGSLGRLEEVTA